MFGAVFAYIVVYLAWYFVVGRSPAGSSGGDRPGGSLPYLAGHVGR